MSELKAGVIATPHNEGMSFHRGSDVIAVTELETEFYLKSEADKVIANSKPYQGRATCSSPTSEVQEVPGDGGFLRVSTRLLQHAWEWFLVSEG